MRNRLFSWTCATIASFTALAGAATLDVPLVYPTIQSAINAASDGDVIVVQAGTYPETINFSGKHVSLEAPAGPAATTIDAQGTGRVMTLVLGESVKVEGFRLANGVAGSAFGDSFGGSAALVLDSGLDLRGCELVGNQASGSGGTLRVAGENGFANPVMEIRDCVFDGNSVTEGGAVRASGSSFVTMAGCHIVSSVATGEGGAVRVSGQATVELTDCSFIGNVAVKGGGALRNSGNSVIVASRCLFSNNQGSEGGAIRASESAEAIVMDSTLIGNRAVASVGAAAYTSEDCRISFSNCTFAKHVTGAAVGTGTNASTISLAGCILWGNFGGAIQGGGVTAEYSDVEGGFVGVGNINQDPLFVNMLADDLRLAAGSPCIDAGNPSDNAKGVDINGDPRVVDGDLNGSRRIDIGSDEFNAVHLAITAASPNLVIDISGQAGLATVLLVGPPGNNFAPEVGAIFVGTPLLIVPWLAVPSNVSVPVPAAPGVTVNVQAVGIGVTSATISNPVTIEL